MKLNRFISEEEEEFLNNNLEKFPFESYKNYFGVKDKEVLEKEIVKKINKILKECIAGFENFSGYTKNDQIRIQFNWNYDNRHIPFVGIGFITLDELKNGFIVEGGSVDGKEVASGETSTDKADESQ